MKRFVGMLLVFATLVCVTVGCRRGGSPGRKPVEVVDAADFIIPPAIGELAGELAKKAPRQAPPNDETPEQKKAREEAEEKAEKEKFKKAQEKRATLLANIAKTYVDYVATSPAPKLNLETFKQRLRRAGLEGERRIVDSKDIEIVFEADVGQADHILAYRGEADNGENEVALANQTVTLVKSDKLRLRLQQQLMKTVWARYKTYAMQEAQRTAEGFKAYMLANTPSTIGNAVANREIMVNMQAQPGNAGQVVACQARSDPNLGGAGKLLGVMGDGDVRWLELELVKTVFPNN